MYRGTITLFNRYPSKALGDKWYPTVIHGVDVNIDRAALIKSMGTDSGDSVSLHIKYTKANDAIMIAGKQYILPKEYCKIAPDYVGEYITFNSGKDFDFFYVGEWDSTEPIDDEAHRQGFYDYMNKEYDNVFAISSASGAYDLIPHFEILGK